MIKRAALSVFIAVLLFSQDHRGNARQLYSERRFAEAAAELEKHLSTSPKDVPSGILLGLSYLQMGDLVRAEIRFAATVRLAPTSAAAHYNLARAQFLRGKFADAERELMEARKHGEPPARVDVLAGLIRAEQDNPEDALALFRKAELSSAADFAEPWIQAGTLLLKLGRAADALHELDTAVRRAPSSAEAFYQRARAKLALQGDAGEDLARAASLGHEGARRLHDQFLSGGAGAVRPGPAQEIVPVVFNELPSGFVLENGAAGSKHLIETMAGGVAAFDYNGDGLTDLFFTNGSAVPSLVKTGSKFWNRLLRNEGGMKFVDVTAEAGLGGAGYSIGAAAADFDNDGNVDVFVAGVKRNILYRNLGNGKFSDVTGKSGIASNEWSVAAAWLDYDRDGLLDLFVVNYVKWQPENEPFCGDASKSFRVYCHPKHYAGTSNALYRNLGGGRFEDVSVSSGVAAYIGKGMSAAVADYDKDGFPDIYVTNDNLPNLLFHNRRDGTFEEIGLKAGAALLDDGRAVSSMGIDFRDYDNDGLPDLVATALAGETFPLFRNQGKGFFRDATYASRLGLLAARRSGWAAAFVDFNNDGFKDLFTANSHVTDNIEAFSSDKYKESNTVFLNRGDGTLDTPWESKRIAAYRGAAFADFNNDGRIDVAVSALGERAALLENASAPHHHWLIVRLEGTRSNRDGIGAVVQMDGQVNHMTSAVGYASSSHAGVHFGLGSKTAAREIRITWPSGAIQVMRDVKSDQVLRVREPA